MLLLWTEAEILSLTEGLDVSLPTVDFTNFCPSTIRKVVGSGVKRLFISSLSRTATGRRLRALLFTSALREFGELKFGLEGLWLLADLLSSVGSFLFEVFADNLEVILCL